MTTAWRANGIHANVNVHFIYHIEARSESRDNTTWLELKFNGEPLYYINLFLEGTEAHLVAAKIAQAINQAYRDQDDGQRDRQD